MTAWQDGYVVIDLHDTGAKGVDLPGFVFDDFGRTDTGLVVVLPDGVLRLDPELVRNIGYQETDRDTDRVVLILYLYEETEIISEIQIILCYGDTLYYVQLLINGVPIRYVRGRLAVTVEYCGSPSPGAWRIGRYGDFYTQESVFEEEEGLVTFFPDRLSNFVVGYSAEARTIAVFRADGDSVALYSRGLETTNLRSGQRLSSGDRLTTGRGSEVFFTMDNSSIIKLGENSQAEIIESGRNLQIRVQAGDALVRISDQQPHHATTVRAQNIGIAVRGTMFVVSVDGYGNETVVMLSGYAEVNGVLLVAGYMYVLEYGADYTEHEYVIKPITLGVVNGFTRAAILGNRRYLGFDIDLSGVNITAHPLPTLYEIRSLVLEDPETDETAYCGDDCAPMTEPDEIYIMYGRRLTIRRC